MSQQHSETEKSDKITLRFIFGIAFAALMMGVFVLVNEWNEREAKNECVAFAKTVVMCQRIDGCEITRRDISRLERCNSIIFEKAGG